MATHTPGPWRVEPTYHNRPGPEGGEGYAIGTSYQWPEGEQAFVGIAFTPAKGVGPYAKHRDADARLIAAAPELLSALKRAVADAAPATNPSARMPNYEQACAAIAKAEGQ